MKLGKRILALLLACVMLAAVFTGCKKDKDPDDPDEQPGNKQYYDNETTRLVLSISELDGVFNPFYSSSAPDGEIVGMTQLSMLSSDKYGKVAFGENEACVVLDYEAVPQTDGDGNTLTTTYRFVLKNNLKFSNGTPLTMKDVLFNLYVYLDPAYYGSSTVYSTDIVGLKEYRTQTKNENEQNDFNAGFDEKASIRLQNLCDALELIYDDNKGTSLTEAQMQEFLAEEMRLSMEQSPDGGYETLVSDYNLAKDKFREELTQTYTYSKGTAQDISFTDKDGNKVTLETDTEAFLYNMGFITWNKKDKVFEYSLGKDQSKTMTEEAVKEAIFNTYFPNDVISVLLASSTANELFTYFSALAKEEYFQGIDPNEKITNVSGIKYANRTAPVTVNGKEYGVPVLNADGSVASGNEVLEITINKVDPKAIWNFGFTVAPMYYYSNAEQIGLFDYENHFGVEYGSVTFQDNVIKNPDKIGVPVGAGPYKATTQSGDGSNVTAGSFKSNNVVYFERNTNFLFDVKIKYINYQVVSTNLMLETLYSGGVHFVQPACKQENIDSLQNKKDDGFGYSAVMTNGYGYIGINAGKVPNINVRRAIMYAINTQYCLDYYLGFSHSISRPMTKASWAYPDDVTGQYYPFDPTGDICEQLVLDADYSLNADGVYQKGNDVLKYTFTIAGDTTDHPAYNSLKQAAELLNAHGFDIEVKTDINALKKLNNGDLTVWAAAWGAGIDPDMYQVYHIDSTAGATANWGYREIRKNVGGKYDTEKEIVGRLSEKIDEARETLNETRRKELYAEALDIVMELAVELPAYQRSDLFAYNSDVIDVSTLTPPEDLTPYNGPLSHIWEVSLNVAK